MCSTQNNINIFLEKNYDKLVLTSMDSMTHWNKYIKLYCTDTIKVHSLRILLIPKILLMDLHFLFSIKAIGENFIKFSTNNHTLVNNNIINIISSEKIHDNKSSINFHQTEHFSTAWIQIEDIKCAIELYFKVINKN